MKLRQSMLLTAVIAAFVFPVGSYAQDASKGKTREAVKTELDAAHKAGTHDMGGEVSTVKPAKSTAGKTREGVKTELDAAHKDGTHEMGNDVSTVKPAPATSGKSRKQVKKELANMSEEEKAKLKDSNLGAK